MFTLVRFYSIVRDCFDYQLVPDGITIPGGVEICLSAADYQPSDLSRFFVCEAA